MTKERIHKRGIANAFYVFLIKTKLVYQITNKFGFVLQSDEFHKVTNELKNRGLSKPSKSTLPKIFASTFNQRSCVLAKDVLNSLCSILDFADYDDFILKYEIDFNHFIYDYKDKFVEQIFNEQVAFYDFDKKNQDFILKQIKRIVIRDFEFKVTKTNMNSLYKWLSKNSKNEDSKQDNEMKQLVLDKRLNYYCNLINRSKFSFLQILIENINAEKNPFYKTGISEIFAHDLMQIWKNGATQNASRLYFYEDYIKNNGISQNIDLLQSFWLGAFSKEKIINNFDFSELEIEKIIAENIKTMNNKYDELID